MRRFIIGLALLSAGCSTSYVTTAKDLDTGNFQKTSVLVSETVPAPTESQKDAKVVVLAHGYTATTYEMQALQEHLEAKNFLVSNVLLGGHGTSVEKFAGTTWQDWGGPVAAEYLKLRELGFRDVSVVGASTGGALFLEMLAAKQLEPAPQRVVLVAPLVMFTSNTIAFTGLLEWFGAKSSPSEMGQNKEGNWYRNRPVGTLKSLVDLTEIVKGRLRAGIPLETGSKALVIQSDQDPTVDPASAQLILKGLQGSVALRMIHSRQHVPIRPPHVDRDWTPQEIAQQQELLLEIERFIAL